MMKKIIAVLMGFTLSLSSVSGIAETEGKTVLGSVEMKGAFTLHCALPEGYTAEVLQSNPDYYLAVITAADEHKHPN